MDWTGEDLVGRTPGYFQDPTYAGEGGGLNAWEHRGQAPRVILGKEMRLPWRWVKMSAADWYLLGGITM